MGLGETDGHGICAWVRCREPPVGLPVLGGYVRGHAMFMFVCLDGRPSLRFVERADESVPARHRVCGRLQ